MRGYQPYLQVLAEHHVPISPAAKVLDFGCGKGVLVASLVEDGFDAYGCDIVLEAPTERMRLMRAPDYLIPFPDAYFDVVLSAEVLEHVQEHDLAFAEIARVLKPQGAAIHVFPSRYAPLEMHTFVPLASLSQGRGWLKFWAALGVRNSFQRGLPWRERAESNYRYLRAETNYPPLRTLIRQAENYFGSVATGEGSWLRAGGQRRMPEGLGRRRTVAAVYGVLYERVLIVADPMPRTRGAQRTERSL